MRHVYDCPLRWADMDSLGHVNNVTYVDYLQEARVDLLHGHPELLGGEGGSSGTIVVSHDISYLRPLVFRPAPVHIEVWATQVRRASFTLAYEIFDRDDDGARQVYATAETVLAPFDFAADAPRRLTDAERDVLERFLDDTTEANR